MRLAEERFKRHLVEDESIRALGTGRLLEDAVGGRTAIGLTDRRLLCVSTAGEFVDVKYDYVCSIRSGRRSRVEYRSRSGTNRLLHLAGGLAAIGALVAAVVSLTTIPAIEGVASLGLAAVTVAVAAGVQHVRSRSGVARAHESVLVGAGVLALLGLAGAGLVAASVSASLFVLATLAGAALVGYAVRHWEDLAGLGVDRRYETLLTINTVDGETVRLVVDVDSDLDRELSVSVHRHDPASVEFPSVPSPSD